MMDLFVPRKCEDCNLCCKLPEIPSINKKSYSWCKSCDIGIGCKIYDNKPKKCNEFSYCLSRTFYRFKTKHGSFMIFPQNEMSYEHKVFTVYCEEFKLQNFIINIKKDWKMLQLIKDKWSFHIRYNEDDDKLAIYNPNVLEDKLIFVSRSKMN